MKKPDQHTVDEVFAELGNYTPDLEEAQLDDFAVRLDKMRYHRFGWRHFNVYYTLLAGFCFMLSIYSAVNYFNDRSAKEKIGYNISLQHMTIAPLEHKENGETGVATESKVKVKSVIAPLPAGGGTVDLAITLEDSLSNEGTAYREPAASKIEEDGLSALIKKDSLKPKTVVYVRTRDTIFTYDTVKVKKKRK